LIYDVIYRKPLLFGLPVVIFEGVRELLFSEMSDPIGFLGSLLNLSKRRKVSE
jgi:hypothetical protein